LSELPHRLACDDVAAERERHEALGAVVVRQVPNCTTLLDPMGLAYCITRRAPSTGTLQLGARSAGPGTMGASDEARDDACQPG
jgi:hypothetical protein